MGEYHFAVLVASENWSGHALGHHQVNDNDVDGWRGLANSTEFIAECASRAEAETLYERASEEAGIEFTDRNPVTADQEYTAHQVIVDDDSMAVWVHEDITHEGRDDEALAAARDYIRVRRARGTLKTPIVMTLNLLAY